jgi:hypothetical protein
MELVEVARPTGLDAASRSRGRSSASQSLIKTAIPLVAFVAGGALGAWLTGLVGLRSIGLATLAAGALTGQALRTPPK